MRKKRRLMGLNLTARQQRLLETLVFLIKVLLLSLPIYLVIALGISLSPLQNFDAAISSGILRALGYVVSQEGAHITVGDTNPFSFYLTEDCTAWKSFILLFALIFAVPAVRLGSRIRGILFGIPVLWIGNQARIIGVVLTERATNVQFAMLTHDYLWRLFLVFLVLSVWLFWIKYPDVEIPNPAKKLPKIKMAIGKPVIMAGKSKRLASKRRR